MRLFVNYAHSDLSAVEQIGDFLHSQNHDISSEEQLLPAHDWIAKLSEQINTADAVIYAISPDALASEWCQWGVARAVKAGKAIIPALLRESASLPSELEHLKFIDLAGGMSEEDKIALTHALANLGAYKVDTIQTITAPEEPAGIPAQAVGTIDINRATSPKRTLLPNVLNVLPPPFEWLEITSGTVTLKDVSTEGGSTGGTYNVKNFAIGKYAVTNAQFRAFADDAKGYDNEHWWDFSDAAKAWREVNITPPVLSDEAEVAAKGISWFDAVAFCRWLNVRVRPGLAMLNRSMQQNAEAREAMPTIALPTEQQWQHAVENDSEQLDMSGNLLEWCMTSWGNDQVVLSGDVERVIRVGSLEHDTFTRQTHRDLAKPDSRDSEFGFRLVCYLP